MRDDDFEWDDDKAARNWRDHAVTFEMARAAFRDPFAVEWQDPEQDPNEVRYAVIAMVQGRLICRLHHARREDTDHHSP